MAVTPDGRRPSRVRLTKRCGSGIWTAGQTIRTLEGHTSSSCCGGNARRPPRRLEFDDGTLRLWDLESGQTIRTLEGHRGWVLAVAVTPDGAGPSRAQVTERCGSGTWRPAKRSASSKAIRARSCHDGDARRTPCRLGLDGPNAAALGLGDRPNHPHPRRPYGRGPAVAVTPDGRRAVSGRMTERCGSGTWRAAKRSAPSKAIRARSGRGGDARRAPRRLGLGGPNAAALGLGERPNVRTSKAMGASAPWR